MTDQYVVTVDVGVRNLGLCVYDFGVQRVVLLKRVALCEECVYKPQRNVQYIKNFLN